MFHSKSTSFAFFSAQHMLLATVFACGEMNPAEKATQAKQHSSTQAGNDNIKLYANAVQPPANASIMPPYEIPSGFYAGVGVTPIGAGNVAEIAPGLYIHKPVNCPNLVSNIEHWNHFCTDDFDFVIGHGSEDGMVGIHRPPNASICRPASSADWSADLVLKDLKGVLGKRPNIFAGACFSGSNNFAINLAIQHPGTRVYGCIDARFPGGGSNMGNGFISATYEPLTKTLTVDAPESLVINPPSEVRLVRSGKGITDLQMNELLKGGNVCSTPPKSTSNAACLEGFRSEEEFLQAVRALASSRSEIKIPETRVGAFRQRLNSIPDLPPKWSHIARPGVSDIILSNEDVQELISYVAHQIWMSPDGKLRADWFLGIIGAILDPYGIFDASWKIQCDGTKGKLVLKYPTLIQDLLAGREPPEAGDKLLKLLLRIEHKQEEFCLDPDTEGISIDLGEIPMYCKLRETVVALPDAIDRALKDEGPATPSDCNAPNVQDGEVCQKDCQCWSNACRSDGLSSERRCVVGLPHRADCGRIERGRVVRDPDAVCRAPNECGLIRFRNQYVCMNSANKGECSNTSAGTMCPEGVPCVTAGFNFSHSNPQQQQICDPDHCASDAACDGTAGYACRPWSKDVFGPQVMRCVKTYVGRGEQCGWIEGPCGPGLTCVKDDGSWKSYCR